MRIILNMMWIIFKSLHVKNVILICLRTISEGSMPMSSFIFVQTYQEKLEIKLLTSKLQPKIWFTNIITMLHKKEYCSIDLFSKWVKRKYKLWMSHWGSQRKAHSVMLNQREAHSLMLNDGNICEKSWKSFN